MALLSVLLRRQTPPPVAEALLLLAAVAVAVAGYLHGRLFWEGYSHVWVVGPLFWLNAVASGVVVAALLLGRALLFALGGLAISLGAIVSILISHSTSFFGFAEQSFDSRATTIVIAEIVAAAAILVALAVARARILDAAGGTDAGTEIDARAGGARTG